MTLDCGTKSYIFETQLLRIEKLSISWRISKDVRIITHPSILSVAS